jgi:hypothetical protein
MTAIVDDEDYDRVSMSRWHFSDGYAARRITEGGRSRIQKMARFIMGEPDGIVDHRSMNTLDNRRDNLRVTGKAQNMQNRGATKKNTSGFKGVSWNKKLGKWTAQIKAFGKHKYLGVFTDIKKAAEAYESAAMELHGDFARLEAPAEIPACASSEPCAPRPLFAQNTSGVTGVVFRKSSNKWRARITRNGVEAHLGDFTDKNEAQKARLAAEAA